MLGGRWVCSTWNALGSASPDLDPRRHPSVAVLAAYGGTRRLGPSGGHDQRASDTRTGRMEAGPETSHRSHPQQRHRPFSRSHVDLCIGGFLAAFHHAERTPSQVHGDMPIAAITAALCATERGSGGIDGRSRYAPRGDPRRPGGTATPGSRCLRSWPARELLSTFVKCPPGSMSEQHRRSLVAAPRSWRTSWARHTEVARETLPRPTGAGCT